MAALRVALGGTTSSEALSLPQSRKEKSRDSNCRLQAWNVSQIGWSSALSTSHELFSPVVKSNLRSRESWVVEAAWTRRSKGQPSKNKKSWGQRTQKFYKPFMLDVFISSKYVHAKVMHRVTSTVVSVATTNAKDLRLSLPSLVDKDACKLIGQLIAERCLEADVYAVAFELRKNEKLEGKLAVVIDSVIEHGLTLAFPWYPTTSLAGANLLPSREPKRDASAYRLECGYEILLLSKSRKWRSLFNQQTIASKPKLNGTYPNVCKQHYLVEMTEKIGQPTSPTLEELAAASSTS